MTATTETTPPPLPFSKSKWSELLTAYFYSGWAFVIPYLATHIDCAKLKWPANPAAGIVITQPLPQPKP